MAVLVGGGAGPAGAVRAPVCQERGPGPSAPSLSLPTSPSPLLPSSVPHPGRARARPAGELPAGCCLPRPALAGLDKACLPVDFGFLGAPGPRWGEGPGQAGVPASQPEGVRLASRAAMGPLSPQGRESLAHFALGADE